MPTQERQVRKFACVIENEPNKDAGGVTIAVESLEEHLKELKTLMPCNYWAIVHDQDKDDDGNFKRSHTHVVLETRTRHTCLGVVRLLAESFGVASDRVSVRETKNQNQAIRYLMHLDDFEKTPYPPFDVITDCPDNLNYAIQSTEQELNWETLKKAIHMSKNLDSLVSKIGLKNYSRYRAVIQDFVRFKERE